MGTLMKMIWVTLRSESVLPVIDALRKAGFHGMTRLTVSEYGKEPPTPSGFIPDPEIPKEMLMIVLPELDVAKAVIVIKTAARECAKDHFGTGIPTKETIFVTYVEDIYTISTARKNPGAEEE